MAKGTFQHIVIGGNLGQDPDLRYTQSGTAVANLSVGVTDYAGKDQQTGQAKHETEWFRVVVFGAHAEAMKSYAQKGTKVQVSGRMKTRKWTDQQGVERYNTELIANEVNIMGNGIPRQQGTQGGFGGGQPQTGFGGAPSSGAQGQPRTTAQSPASTGAPTNFDDFDDDIPF